MLISVSMGLLLVIFFFLFFLMFLFDFGNGLVAAELVIFLSKADDFIFHRRLTGNKNHCREMQQRQKASKSKIN